MALSMFSQKVFRAEITRGVDLESRVYLVGDRLTVGTGADDDLRLGAPGIVPGQLTFERQKTGSGWEYFSSDRGLTQVKSGNPRTGRVTAGLWFDLGGDTRLEISKAPLPDHLRQETKVSDKTEIPLGIALPILGLMVVGAGFLTSSFGGASQRAELRTTDWFTAQAPLEPAIEICVAAGLSPEAAAISSAGNTSLDALYRRYQVLIDQNKEEGRKTLDDLTKLVRGIIAESHLLILENRPMAASETLLRLENVLPVGNGECPILAASRSDLALLALRAGRARN